MPRAALNELAYRNQDGLEVTLFWDARSNEVSIDVVDQRHQSGFRLPVARHLALDAFHHPYAYALSLETVCDPLAQPA